MTKEKDERTLEKSFETQRGQFMGQLFVIGNTIDEMKKQADTFEVCTKGGIPQRTSIYDELTKMRRQVNNLLHKITTAQRVAQDEMIRQVNKDG